VSAEDYLRAILQREAVDTGPFSLVRSVQTALDPIIREWAGTQLVSVAPSGSFSKVTANRSGTDIDLFISLKADTRETLKEIYYGLFNRMTQKGYAPKHQNVSINVRGNGYDVDLVPAKRQGPYGEDHSLFRRKADTWTKTNVTTHINTVRQAGRTYESRILKLWRNQGGIDAFGGNDELILEGEDEGGVLAVEDDDVEALAEVAVAVDDVGSLGAVAEREIGLQRLGYAQKKMASVRRLYRTSLPIPHAGGTYPPKPLPHILGGLLSLASGTRPSAHPSTRRSAAIPSSASI